MAEKTVIYYYSGSGNSLSASKQVAEKLGNTDIISIYNLRENPIVPEKYEHIGIVTSTWFIRPPRIVKEICEKLTFSKNKKVFIIATCGGNDGFVRIDLKEILKPKTEFPIQTFMLKMPPNHIVGFSPFPAWIVKIYLKRATKTIERITERIQSGKPTRNRKAHGRKFLTWASIHFNRSLGVDRDSVEGGFYTTEACTKCGTCEKICKNRNILFSKGKVEWGHDCQQCMACIMWCPNKAIWHPNVPKNRRRYQNPNITLDDMLRSEFLATENKE